MTEKESNKIHALGVAVLSIVEYLHAKDPAEYRVKMKEIIGRYSEDPNANKDIAEQAEKLLGVRK